MMVNNIRPELNVEWLWTLDLVDLSWENLALPAGKRILDAHRVIAIEAVLRRLNGEGMPPETMPFVKLQARREAAEWRDDPMAHATSKRVCFEAHTMTLPSMPRCSFRRKSRSTCLISLFRGRRADKSRCSGRSASAGNLPGAFDAS
jgi:hypothetical protein